MLMLTEPAQAGEGIETIARWQAPFTGCISLGDAAPQPNQIGGHVSVPAVTTFPIMTASWLDWNDPYQGSPCVLSTIQKANTDFT